MATRMRRERRHPRRAGLAGKLAIPLGLLALVLAIAAGVGAAWAIRVYDSAPALDTLKPVQKGRSSAIYAADGSLIGFIRSNNVRQPVSSKALPQSLKEATIAIEDKNFYSHGALDYAGILRAAWEDIKAGGKPVQGASTITQQLVRNLYIQNPQDTIERKVIEARLAQELFERHDRDWILTNYLNTSPYGTVEGQTAVGAEAAAQTYFGKPAKDLTLTESALIAGLPQAPSEYNPFLDPKAAKQRRNEVLRAMEEEGYISAAQYRRAVERGLGLNPGDKYSSVSDPFLFSLVEQELINRYGINTVRNGGLKAYTTIDPELQARAQEAVDSCAVCYPEGGPAAGLASVNPENGEIVALASTQGSETESQFNYAWQAHRQPGSSFKTFVLVEAVKQGIDPDSTYYDGSSPKVLTIPGGGTWEVNNAEGGGGGTMSLASATWSSTNVVYAQLDLDVGPENVTETAREMGIKARLLSVPAEGIGGLTEGVTPLEMASGYATLASGGVYHEPTAISRVEFPDGKVEEIDTEDGKRVLSPGEAYEVTSLLEGVISHGTGTSASIGCPAAGKTGTSEEESDAWFVGYTPQLSAAVWVGHPQSREYTGYGGEVAAPIWRYFMETANTECAEFEVPSSLPELESFEGDHTSSSSEDSYGYDEYGEEESYEYGEAEEEEGDGDEAGGGEGGGEEAAEQPSAPPPTTTPAVQGGVASPG